MASRSTARRPLCLRARAARKRWWGGHEGDSSNSQATARERGGAGAARKVAPQRNFAVLDGRAEERRVGKEGGEAGGRQLAGQQRREGGVVEQGSAGRRRALRCAILFFQAEDGIRDPLVTGVQTCALPISGSRSPQALVGGARGRF